MWNSQSECLCVQKSYFIPPCRKILKNLSPRRTPRLATSWASTTWRPSAMRTPSTSATPSWKRKGSAALIKTSKIKCLIHTYNNKIYKDAATFYRVEPFYAEGLKRLLSLVLSPYDVDSRLPECVHWEKKKKFWIHIIIQRCSHALLSLSPFIELKRLLSLVSSTLEANSRLLECAHWRKKNTRKKIKFWIHIIIQRRSHTL